uniref:Uncharacterized protein n=1 Tax=Leersia perrieri TaxID=77586 RepID=A0A0D9XW60_9ORYZ
MYKYRISLSKSTEKKRDKNPQFWSPSHSLSSGGCFGGKGGLVAGGEKRAGDLDAEACIPYGEILVLGREDHLLRVLHHRPHRPLHQRGARAQLRHLQRPQRVPGVHPRRQPTLARSPEVRHVVLVAGDQQRVQLPLLLRARRQRARVEEGEEVGELVVAQLREGDRLAGGGLVFVVAGEDVTEHLRPGRLL